MASLRSHRPLTSLALVSALWLAACGTSPTAPALESLTVQPATVTLEVGATQQLTVIGHYDDGSTAPLTAGVTYATSSAQVVTVSTAGLVTAVNEGTATVTASTSGKTVTVAVTVSAPPPPALTAISVTPATVTLTAGDTQALTVTGTYDDGSTATLTAGVTFASSAEAVATVGATGVVTAVAAGTATITATETASALTATSAVTVSGAALPGAVFTDDYAADVSFADFGGATNAVSLDTTEHHGGTTSLKVEVPASGYTGGALVASTPRDLTGFNALTFWVKASQAATLDVAGLGNAADGNLDWSAELAAIPVTTGWTEVVLPIPDATKAAAITGLFHFAEGSNEGAYTLWFDDVAYQTLDATALGAPTAAAVTWPTLDLATGGTSQLSPTGNTLTYATPAETLTTVGFRWFDLTSSDPGVATVDPSGLVTGVADGTCTVTGAVAGLTVPGSAAVTVSSTPQAPTTAPTAPTADAASVTSIYSGTYTDVPVDSYAAAWSSATLTQVTIDAEPMLAYTDLDFVGIEFTGANLVDASARDHFHVDVWTPNATQVQVKLVDFGADGAYGGGDDTEGQLTFDASSTPALAQGGWVAIDVPMSAFAAAGLTSTSHLAQLIFSALPTGSATVYVANVYLYAAGTAQAPTTAPPAPTAAPADVISLFSSAYTDVPVDSYAAAWSSATLTNVTIAGEPMLEYTALDFVGIELTGANLIDATNFPYLHVDLWTPNITQFQVKLVDFGADGAYGGGDDTEGQLTFDATTTPAVTQGGWVSLELPMSDFMAAGLTHRAHLAQLIFSALPTGTATAYVDNVYFHK